MSVGQRDPTTAPAGQRQGEGDASRPQASKRKGMDSARASELASAYWKGLTPVQKRIRLLRGQVAIGDHARRELAALRAQLDQIDGGTGAP